MSFRISLDRVTLLSFAAIFAIAIELEGLERKYHQKERTVWPGTSAIESSMPAITAGEVKESIVNQRTRLQDCGAEEHQ